MLTFWDLTPAETLAEIEGALWRAERQRQQDMSLAWHTAALTRSKRMPGLRALIGRGEAKPLTPEEAAQRAAEHEEMVARVTAQMAKLKPEAGSRKPRAKS